MLIHSPVRQESPFLGITGVQFFQTELKTVKMVIADANLKVLKTRRTPSQNMGEFIVARPRPDEP